MITSRLWVYSGDRPSNGAKELASEDSFLRLRKGREYKVRPKDFLVNWGCTNLDLDIFTVQKILNKPEKIYAAVNKLIAFNKMSLSPNVVNSLIPWTEDRDIAQDWSNDGSTVVVRNKLTGHSGDGIVIIDKLQPIPQAPLYTKYVFKVKEYRVHVVNGKVIDTQQKIRDPDREVVTWKVRSHANGFIFARNGIESDPARDSLAISAVSALGLDFGAVDIIEDKKGVLYVLEINAAPGLEGQTIKSYADAFRGYHHGG